MVAPCLLVCFGGSVWNLWQSEELELLIFHFIGKLAEETKFAIVTVSISHIGEGVGLMSNKICSLLTKYENNLNYNH